MKKFLMLLLALTFALSVAACGGDTDDNGDPDPDPEPTTEDLIANAISRVSWQNTGSYEASTISLPTNLVHGVSVSWVSSNEDVVSIDGNVGRVTRPTDDSVDVTLTATFSLDGVEVTRDYEFTIMPIELPDVEPYYTDFSQLYEDFPTAGDAPSTIAVEGIVTGHFSGGYFLFDGTVHMSVFNAFAGGTRFELGDRVVAVGGLGQYHSLLQIAGPSQEVLLSSGNDYTVPVEDITISELLALDSSDRTLHGRHFRIQGLVEERTTGEHDNLFIVDGDNFVRIYHFSFFAYLDVLEERIGDWVELTVVYYTDHSRDGLLVMFQGTEDDVTTIVLEDDERVANAKEALTLIDIDEVTADLTLPLEGAQGTTISWSSSDTDIIANNGTVTRPEGENPVTVTLTATITYGDESDTKVFTVTVMPVAFVPSGMSVEDALLEADGEEISVEGVVTSFRSFTGGFFMQDADGTAIYVDTEIEGLEVGNFVVIRGTLSTHTDHSSERRQLNDAELRFNDEDIHTVFIEEGMSIIEIINDYPNAQSRRFRVENADIKEFVAQFNEFHLVGTEEMSLIFDVRDYGSYWPLLFDNEFNTIDYIEFTVNDLWHGNLRVAGVILPEPTQAQLEIIADDVLALRESTISNLDLPDYLVLDDVSYLEDYAYAITWTSSDADVITNDGVVTRPAEGQPDAVVTMTATVVLPDADYTIDFDVTVRAQTPEGEEEELYTTDFSTTTNISGSTGYAVGRFDDQGYTWMLDSALLGNLDGDTKLEGSLHAIRGRTKSDGSPGIAELEHDFANVTTISFFFALTNFADVGDGLLSVEISNDGGTTWTEIMVPTAPSDTLEEIVLTLNYDELDGFTFGDEIRVRFLFTGAGGSVENATRVNIAGVTILGEE